jgi:GntR family transcriptional regulator, transcriptional repressor for pyruvate dehydrogenase complex
MFKQIKVRHISEEVFDQIKEAILEGKLKPGQKLPTERELMSQLGVSRVPIREALKLLVNMGFIETTQGGGSYVRALLAQRVRDPLNHIIKDDVENIFDLLEVRKELETWSAYHAAEKATEEDIASLGRMIEETQALFRGGKKPPVALDADFHLAIAQCTHNTIRSHLTFTIYDIFSEYFNYLFENICFSKQYQESIYDQHFHIYDAIRSHDAEAARNAVTNHLAFVGEELRKQTGGRDVKKEEGKGKKRDSERAGKAKAQSRP